MKILIVSQYFWPEQFRINEIAKYLKVKNLEVDVLTGYPNYPGGKIFKNYLLRPEEYKNYYNANIYRLPIISRNNSNKFWLLLNYMSFVVSGVLFAPFILRKKKYDLVFTFATSPITVALVSIYVAKIKKCKSILWILDLWPEILKELKIITNPFLLSIINSIVLFIYRKTDILLVQSRSFKRIIDKKIKNKKCIYFPAWPENFNFTKKLNFKLNKNKNKFNIVFTGNVGEAQNFDNIFKVMNYYKNSKKINWLIVGGGRKLQKLKKEARVKNIRNIKFYGNIPMEKIPTFHKIADVLLISLNKGIGLSATIPGKLQTYLNSNKYILGMIDGESQRIINHSNAGSCVNSDDVDGMIKKIDYLSLNIKKIKKERKKTNTAIYVQKYFSKEKILLQLFNIFKKIFGSKITIKLIVNISKIPFDRNFTLSGLNLAFLGFYSLNKIKFYKNLYHWPDGVFAKRFIDEKKYSTKVPGRDIIRKMKLPPSIKKIIVIGNLTTNSKNYLRRTHKKEIDHIKSPYGSVNEIYDYFKNKRFKVSDLIIMTLPTPKQEQVAEKISVNSKFYKIICIGGAISMASGDERNIPIIFEKYGLEFLWRLRIDSRRRIHRLFISFFSYIHASYKNKFLNINLRLIK